MNRLIPEGTISFVVDMPSEDPNEVYLNPSAGLASGPFPVLKKDLEQNIILLLNHEYEIHSRMDVAEQTRILLLFEHLLLKKFCEPGSTVCISANIPSMLSKLSTARRKCRLVKEEKMKEIL